MGHVYRWLVLIDEVVMSLGNQTEDNDLTVSCCPDLGAAGSGRTAQWTNYRRTPFHEVSIEVIERVRLVTTPDTNCKPWRVTSLLLYCYLNQSIFSTSTSLTPRTIHESPTELIAGLGFRKLTFASVSEP
jgi:hypothetical protein